MEVLVRLRTIYAFRSDLSSERQVLFATSCLPLEGGGAIRKTHNIKFSVYVDFAFNNPYTYSMKRLAAIILLAIAVGIVIPPSLSLTIVHGGQKTIGALDVCHSSVPALSSNGEMPCMSICPGKQHPVLSVIYSTREKPLFTQTLFPLDNEHPPKA